MCATKKHQIKKNTHIHIYTKEYNYYINNNTTPNNVYLDSREDEDRSEMRYVVWIAGISESSNLWTHVALSWSPPESTFAWVPLLFIIEMRIYNLAARASRVRSVDDTGFVCACLPALCTCMLARACVVVVVVARHIASDSSFSCLVLSFFSSSSIIWGGQWRECPFFVYVRRAWGFTAACVCLSLSCFLFTLWMDVCVLGFVPNIYISIYYNIEG